MSRKSAEHGFHNSKVGRVGSEGEGRSSPCLATAQTTILLSSSMTVRNAVALCSFFYDGCIKGIPTFWLSMEVCSEGTTRKKSSREDP